MIHLSGIIEEIFGSSIVLRGYTTLKNLVDISERPDYQRKEDKTRLEEIEKYIKGTSFRFFPELLFGWQIGIDDFRTRIREEKKDTIVISDNVSILKKKSRFGKNKENDLKVVDIKIKNSEKILKRIDGNHRLCAIEKILAENPDVINEYGDIVVPFSILMQPKSAEAEKKETAFFYLINSKAKPLTDEQNLKSIFVGDKFDEIEKQNLAIVSDVNKFENIAKIIINGDYSFVNNIFKNEAFTLALKIFDNIGDETTASSIKKALVQIEALFTSEKLTSENKNIIVSLIVAYAKHGNDFFDGYKKWLTENQLSKIEDVKPNELLSSFEELRKVIHVFVAMPYFDNDEKIVEDYNRIYRNTLQQVAKDYSIDIFLYPIMCNKGETRDQIRDIMKKIRDCNVFFADITGNNPNVTYEMGWARAMNKKVIIVRRKGTEQPKSDYKNDTYHDYDDNARSVDLARVINENLVEVLEKNYGLIKK